MSALDGHRRYLVEKAREALAKVDLSDDREMARTIGRLEISLEQLLEIVDPEGSDGAQSG
ncbi:hypothetical protein ACFYQA_38655 [Streptomyces sp. NPDC005774]|uniref:hypothetical protein n=1 Tax=Streptomyces sp. NPDC005774 TaxID=3364728 RepID=UPI0036A5A059